LEEVCLRTLLNEIGLSTVEGGRQLMVLSSRRMEVDADVVIKEE